MNANEIQEAQDLSVAILAGSTIAGHDEARELRDLGDQMSRSSLTHLGGFIAATNKSLIAADGLMAIIKNPAQAERRTEVDISPLPIAFYSIREETKAARVRLQYLEEAVKNEKELLEKMEKCNAAIPPPDEWHSSIGPGHLPQWLKIVKFLNFDAEKEACENLECQHCYHYYQPEFDDTPAECPGLILPRGLAIALMSSTHFGCAHHKEALLDFINEGYKRPGLDGRYVCIQKFYALESGQRIIILQAGHCASSHTPCASICVTDHGVTFKTCL